MITQTTNKKKIYTVPEGVYDGEWSGGFVWLKKEDRMFHRFETKHARKLRPVNVTVTIEGARAIVIVKQIKK